MPIFKYQPYYKYNGPTLSQPFREELSADAVKRNMGLFFDEIGSYFVRRHLVCSTASLGLLNAQMKGCWRKSNGLDWGFTPFKSPE